MVSSAKNIINCLKNIIRVLVLFGFFLTSTTSHGANTVINSKPLREAVTLDAIVGHLEIFQGIANENGGTRFSGTPGHLATVEYAESLLTTAGYVVSRQEFDFPFFQQVSPPELEELSPVSVVYAAGTDILTVGFSGSGEVVAEVVPVDVQVPATGVSMTSGCEMADFFLGQDSIVTGKIALIQRGTCAFLNKVQNAIAAGAIGVIIFNQGTPGRTGILDATVGTPVAIPVISSSYGVGEDVVEQTRAGHAVIMRMKTDTVSQLVHSVNLLADWPAGDPNQKIVFVSALNGTVDGPAINFPGTGAATMLETALRLPETGAPRKRVRFAFFDGAQGQGQLFYRNSLSQAEWESHEAFVGADAIGSSNFVRFVYDGDNSSGLNVSPPPDGSGFVESILLEGFLSGDLPTAPTGNNIIGLQTFSLFRQPFPGIAGVTTGGPLIKTVQEEDIFGGTAGVAYDPFPGVANDLNSVNTEVLEQMKEALVHAVYTVIRTKSPITDSGTVKRGKPNYALPNEGICGDDLSMCSQNLN